MAKEPVRILYEHSTDADLEGSVYDGMQDLLGDDILSSDYDPTIGEVWPGVNPIPLPWDRIEGAE